VTEHAKGTGEVVAATGRDAEAVVRGRPGRRTIAERQHAVLELLAGKASADQLAVKGRSATRSGRWSARTRSTPRRRRRAKAQRFALDGTPLGGIIDPGPDDVGILIQPAALPLANGGFVLAWETPLRVHAYDADGVSLGLPFVVGTGIDKFADVAVSADGTLAAVAGMPPDDDPTPKEGMSRSLLNGSAEQGAAAPITVVYATAFLVST
jgi:hypothetical protein